MVDPREKVTEKTLTVRMKPGCGCHCSTANSTDLEIMFSQCRRKVI